MSDQTKFPSYIKLFGELDFKKGDEARSVYSPAAYLADLVNLLDDNFDNPDLDKRRADIKQLILDADNTFSLIPYLDIVNELLENKIKGKAYDVLKKAQFPFNLPFSLENERVKKYLHYLNIGAEEIYKLFHLQIDPDVVAREYLQLSEEDYNIFKQTTTTENAIKAFYNLKSGDSLNSLKDVTTFLKTTGLSGLEMRELLFQNLSKSEAAQASLFFINNGLGGYAKLDEDEKNIFWVNQNNQENVAIDLTEGEGEEKPENLIPSAWFERVNRLIRLAKRTEISITDLDLILRTCCANQLDANAIQRIAIIQKLRTTFELPIDEVCAFFSNINSLGIGNEDESIDLFNRLFNENYAQIDQKFIKGAQFLPEAFSEYEELRCFGDVLSIENKIYRKRLTKALHISEKSLTTIVNRFREKALTQSPKMMTLSPESGIGIAELSLLFRISKLAEILDSSVEEILDVMELLENDPFIRKYDNFKILIHNKIETLDCFKIISGTDIQASMWLTQILIAVTTWMQENNFTASELQYLQTGIHKNDKVEKAANKKKINSLNNLYQQFKPVALNADYFKSEQFDQRSANVIYDTVKNPDAHLVSKDDARILNYNSAKAAQAAANALDRLKILRKEDFEGLGLEEKMRDKIFTNLIIKGYINAEGRLNEEAIPNNAADFRINNSSTEENKEVFEVIHNLFVQENKKGVNYDTNGGDVLTENGDSTESDLAVFLSDFDGLDLSEVRKTELYDNLIFNGYINDEGVVLKPQFFSEDDNYVHFDANANINTYSKSVYDIIQNNIAQFKSRKLKLNPEDFASLPLKEIEINDLIENLRFNEYIDDQNVFTNKAEMLSLDVKDFNLALMFYPYRHKILDAIKQRISEFKAKFYILQKDALHHVADEIVAGLAFETIEADYLENGALSKENILFFNDEENRSQFELSKYFDDNAKRVVFQAIQKMIVTSQKYQLNEFDLLEFGFDEANLETLMDQLIKKGYLQKDGTISESKLEYYLNINNALDFKLDGFQDFNKDIFFAIHAVAKEMDAGLKEITTKLKTRADQQEQVLFDALQEAFEIPADTVKVICKHLFKHSENILEEFLLPVLSSVDSEDKITKEPKNNKFNYAYRRILQFGSLAAKLGLDKTETDIVFRDQDLVEKFPEKLVLPKELDRFDALLELKIDASNYDELEEVGMIDTICIFNGSQFWAYAAENYNLLLSGAQLSTLSPNFEGKDKVDAAFTDENGNTWLIAGPDYFCKATDGKKWEKKDRVFGKVESNFDELESIDASFIDSEGKTYLFSGDQYLRYSENYTIPDEGYPKKIKDNWKNEHEFDVPKAFEKAIDAAFQSVDDKIFFFKEDKFISSDDFKKEIDINEAWGKVKNNFDNLDKLDATFTFNDKVFAFSGDQVIAYSNSIENDDVFVDEGYPMLLKNWIKDIPDAFEDGVDAVFKGNDDKIHLIKGNNYVSYDLDLTKKGAEKELTKVWGKIKNNITTNGVISAAFTGLDGKAYLFSGDQYYRYSGSSYAKVDEGYPKTISSNWGGLQTVDAAFVLDGKTYLFGKVGEGENKYVRYSNKDYSNHDEGYPMSPDDNWWAIHFNLTETDFNEPDAIFNDLNGKTYLFKGSKFIAYDNKHRWWSEPKNLKENWDSIPFKSVDAAFTGKDGKSYLFSDKKYIRYSDQNFNKIDDRYPKVINTYWGKVANNIEKSKKVDAALVVDSQIITVIEGQETEQYEKHTYLFSGNQFFRYTGNAYDFVDEGYPKMTEPSLKEEPRFKNLKTRMDKGVDAAFADRRNVYLFKDTYSLVVSEEIYEEYPNILDQNIFSAFIENGNVFINNQNGWSKYSNLEGISLSSENTAPTLFREVPDEFKPDLDAVLDGTDINSYLFKGNLCYNVSLDKAYPINEEWGRVKNNIYINNKIDAVFVGMDGKTYLFSDDQFVCYTPEKGAKNVLPKFVDENPKSISEHWGGLANVHLAFIKDEKTYLFEKPNDKGIFRYVCYSSDDYSKPDSTAQMADLNWWNFPAIYMEEGFLNVNAVLFEEDNMFLINEDSFIQYDQAEGVWTYPRPLERIWRKNPSTENDSTKIKTAFKGFPSNESDFTMIKTAFKGIDNKTYFFSEEAFVSYENGDFSPIQEIKSHWGIVDNNIVLNNKIDAAFVLNGETTYLFSGDQYVRYSNGDYRFIDENYPKMIVEDLRNEEGFKNLPDSFEERLKKLANSESNTIIDAVIANSRNIFIFENNNIHVVSQSVNEEFDNKFFGVVNNNIEYFNEVDAAFVSGEHTFLFSGDQYFRYTGTDYDYVDEGYPKAITNNLKAENLSITTDEFQYDIDAAFQGIDDNVYLFKNKSFYRSNSDAAKIPLGVFLGNSNNPFSDSEIPIDATFLAPNGKTYIFKGAHFIRYSNFDNEFIDEGYPKSIKDNWSNLPINYEESINGGFVFEGRTYLIKGDEYVRYSDLNFTAIDRIYPQKFVHRWSDWADFLLSDLKVISHYKKLQNESGGGDYSLNDLLDEQQGYKKEPYEILSEIFEWDVEEVKWLKRKNAFFKPDNDFEVSFDIELILKMAAIFDLTNKAEASPSSFYDLIWKNMFQSKELDKAADNLYLFLGLKNSQKDWETLSKQMHDELNLIKRDALVPYVMSINPEIENIRDLYENLLIDVEMGSSAQTSKIKEAIAAMQLYFHRYFVNLEEVGKLTEDKRDELKGWWKWMKNYRVWEANRKVFLYPENYIRPELRDTKTPAFKALEEALLQGELNKGLVEKCYNDYIDEFATVGNLKITGSNVYKDDEDEVLILFGHTRTDPIQYYYRTAIFYKSGSIHWNNWEKVNIDVNSTRVFPVRAFGRIMLFWIEIEAVEDANAVAVGSSSKATFDTSDRKVTQKANIKYSFYNHNKQWINPQNLKMGIDLDYTIDAAFFENKNVVAFSGKYVLQSSAENPTGDVKTIGEVYTNLPTNFKAGIDAAANVDGTRYFFKDGQCVVNKGKAVSIESLFITLDIKPENQLPFFFPKALVPDNYILAEYKNGVAATFYLDGIMCIIDKKGGYNFFRKGTGNTFNIILNHLDIHSFWNPFIRILTHNMRRLNPVDAVFEDENKVLYVLRKGQYECYTMEGTAIQTLKPLEGYPKPIKGNLTFNMDKFFNKLHVVDYFENGDEFVGVTYTTPKDTVLLSGKINPDLTFEEAELRNDYKIYLILAWERSYVNTLSISFDKYKNTSVQQLFEGTNTTLNDILGEANALKTLDDSLTIILSELAKEKPVKRNFNDAMKLALDHIDALTPKLTDTNFNNSVTQLRGKIVAVNNFFNTSPTKEKDLEKLQKMSNELSSLTRNVKSELENKPFPDITDAVIALKGILVDENKKGTRNQTILDNYNAQTNNLNRYTYASPIVSIFWNIFEKKDDTIATFNTVIESYRKQLENKLENKDSESLKFITQASTADKLSTFIQRINSAISTNNSAATILKDLDKIATDLVKKSDVIITKLSDTINSIRERHIGRFDLFPSQFGIQNKTNFTFSEPDWFIFEAKGGTFLCKPKVPKVVPSSGFFGKKLLHYDIIRLTTTTIPQLSGKLFSGGINQLLSLNTQDLDEMPYFEIENEGAPGQYAISYKKSHIDSAPDLEQSKQLDFFGANGNYYWEIFFHAPFLIAQSLNNAQKFEEAKEWYEYVFDPTAIKNLWKFMPFSGLMTKRIPDFDAQIKVFRDDPFDPHAIARLRNQAYSRSIVMSYIDNLLDWGDMLFRQYTRESINEARMLYVLAYDLLGEQPENLGTRLLSEDTYYSNIDEHSLEFKDIAEEEVTGAIKALPKMSEIVEGTIHNSVKSHYFYIPENSLFLDYWNRVEDRLYKIRHSLNILGIKQALPLFEPPIDPMALVQAVGSGASLSQALAARNVAVPHYRFNFMMYKAKELVQKLNQFGGELLSALEKKDAEELSRMQNKQEGVLLSMMTKVREAQLEEAAENIKSLEESHKNAEDRKKYWEATISAGMLPTEEAQVALMISASAAHFASSVLKIVSSFAGAAPDALIGPFIMGTKIGGSNIGQSISTAAEVAESLGEGLSVTGEVLGMYAQQERMKEDWDLQLMMAESDIKQIDAQIAGSKIQYQVAQYEIALHEKEIEHNESISNFMKQKFSNQQLYQWMSSKLSGLYYQTYKLAYDMAKYAEKSFQFERGAKESDVHFINAMYWDSQRKGLLAGDSLGHDLDRMEQAFIETDKRRFEISKSISLLELDPMAFLQLKNKGVCEFSLSEAMFDYDFQGHYCRQIKTISISFDTIDDKTVNATLTQLNNKTIIEPDSKAVKYLLNPKGTQPLSIRNNWKANQQVALSHIDEYETNNGLFELRFDDDHYLPFEGTGAVSTWRLELNGKKGGLHFSRMVDAVINIKYTALQGGEVFANSVKGALKPYQTVRFFDFNFDFANEWNAFLEDVESDEITLTFQRGHFPDMASSRIAGIFTKFDLIDAGKVSMVLNNDDKMVLKDGKFLETDSLSISNRGTQLTFKLKGNKQNLKNVNLVVSYKAKVN